MSKQSIMLRGRPVPYLALLGATALLVGLYGRFKGIGIWPLGVDEFYISRSIDNILRTGLPQFSCGGYYTRGLAYQYLVGGLRSLGLTPEVAGRLLAGACSVAALPGAYLLARRFAGTPGAYATVVILCLSVWEIEMARFARMYAPFQTVFVWYLVFFLRYTVDGHPQAMRWLIALSVLGVLTWEGGVLLGAANILAIALLHRDGRLNAAQWRGAAALCLLLALLFLATRDLRGFAEAPDAGAAALSGGAGRWQTAMEWLAPAATRSAWYGLLALPFGALFFSNPWLWTFRRHWLTIGGFCAVAAAAAVHVFTLSFGLLVLMLLMNLFRWRDLASMQGRYFTLALLGFLAVWLVLDTHSAVPHGAQVLMSVQRMFGFPDIFDEIVRPWGRTMPLLSISLAMALLYWMWFCILRPAGPPTAMAATLSLIVLMALAVGASATDRLETRYTFFLYPVLVVLGVAAIMRLAARMRLPAVVAVAAPLVCFGASEDFQPRHIAQIDSAAVNFRAGMSAVQAAHYYPRNDMREAGLWLAAHVGPGDVVVTGIPNLDQYYPGFAYFYLEQDDPRYDAYVCQNGTTERWTNHSVLYGVRALAPVMTSARRLLISVYPDVEQRIITAAQSAGLSVTRVWRSRYGNSDVLLIAR